MRRGRMLVILILLLVLVVAGGAAAYFVLGAPGAGPAPTPEAVEVTATPEPILSVLVAAQDLSRGMVIPTEAIAAYPWPTAIVPLAAVTDTSAIVGTRARVDIDRGMPILSNMVVPSLLQLSPFGSDGAAQIPPGFQAISVPYDLMNGVALGPRDGDHVNVIVTWWIVDIDQNFQSILPNLTANVVPPSPGDSTLGIPAGLVGVVENPYYDPGSGPIERGESDANTGPRILRPSGAAQSGPVGRGETDTSTGQDFYVVPSELQRPRLVVQTVIQDALVLHLGTFGEALFPTFLPPTPTVGPDTPVPDVPPPTNTPRPPDSITLVVSPQDVLVLNYVKAMMAKYPGSVQMTLALRSAGDTSIAETESVTLQYMFERFNIALPAKLPYGPYGPAPASVTPEPAVP